MAKSDNSTLHSASDDALNAAQVLFTMNPALGPQTRHFWQAQDRFLQEAEKFSSAWFRRRHDATRAALDAAAQIADKGMGDPASAMKVMADWQAHSMERLAEDVKDCAEMMTNCAGSLVGNEIEAIGETAENANAASKTAKDVPV